MKTRNTIQNKIVLDAVYALGNHPTVNEVYDFISAVHPEIAIATVYRNLNKLAMNGELLKIEVANSADRFDITSVEHYHFQCVDCGAFFDIDLPYMSSLNEMASKASGIQVSGHQLIFIGKCKKCINKTEEN